MTRLAVVVSHPIQYFAPFYAAAAAQGGLDLRVLFCCDWGAETYRDPGFGVDVRWDTPLLTGYAHEFLPARVRPRRLTFLGVDNPAVGARLEAFAPDVLLVHGYAFRTMWRAAAWARSRGVPVLLLSDSSIGRWTAPWKRLPKRVLVRWFYRGVDAAFTTGENNRAYHLRFGLPEDRLLPGLLPAGVERIRAALAEGGSGLRRETRARLGLQHGAFVPMFCGKFVAGKRPGDLLEAAVILRERGRPVAPLMVGDGALRAGLEGRARAAGLDGAVFTGFVNQSGLPALYAAADVLVLPSRHENQGLVVAEAAAAGLPSVVSDAVGCVGATGFARPDVTALVHRCGDVASIAGALDRLIGDGDLRARLAEGAAAAAAEFGATEAARRLEAAGRALVELGPRGHRLPGRSAG